MLFLSRNKTKSIINAAFGDGGLFYYVVPEDSLALPLLKAFVGIKVRFHDFRFYLLRLLLRFGYLFLETLVVSFVLFPVDEVVQVEVCQFVHFRLQFAHIDRL